MYRFSQMFQFNFLASCQIGYGAGYFQNAVMSPGAEAWFFHRFV
jgi:hypothetical protein